MRSLFLKLTTVSLLVLAISACKKNKQNDSPELALENSTWLPSMTDVNPASTPNGNTLYYPWMQCNLNDSFTFRNGKIVAGNNASCNTKNQMAYYNDSLYTYHPEKKEIWLRYGQYTHKLLVLDFTKDHLKLAAVTSSLTGYNYIIYLYKRKQ